MFKYKNNQKSIRVSLFRWINNNNFSAFWKQITPWSVRRSNILVVRTYSCFNIWFICLGISKKIDTFINNQEMKLSPGKYMVNTNNYKNQEITFMQHIVKALLIVIRFRCSSLYWGHSSIAKLILNERI